MKCAKSGKKCGECESNPNCEIYSERYVLMKQLKKLSKVQDETNTILDAILNK